MNEYLIYLKGDPYPIFVWADGYQMQYMDSFYCFFRDGNYICSFPFHIVKEVKLEKEKKH